MSESLQGRLVMCHLVVIDYYYYYHEIVHRVHKNNTKSKKVKKKLKKANVLTPIIAHTANNFINV